MILYLNSDNTIYKEVYHAFLDIAFDVCDTFMFVVITSKGYGLDIKGQ
jgi:hypothetical protein